MGEKIFIGNFPEGQTQNRLPFFIDNNSFPTLYNFYSWRGRAKKKRGTTLINRLARQLNTNVILSGGGTFNLLSGLESSAAVVQKSFNYSRAGNTYTDDGNGNILLLLAIVGSINYATGLVTILTESGQTLVGSYAYNPGLPVMGLEDYISTTTDVSDDTTNSTQYPLLVAFDTTYSYQVTGSNGAYNFYTTNFYKNPLAANVPQYTSYVAKTTQTALTWTGGNYQQFWSSNYEGAMWVTNNVPGMQMQAIKSITWISATSLTIVVTDSPAIVGDFIWINEITGGTSPGTNSINNQSGYVTVKSGSLPGDITLTAVFPNANFINTTYTGGVIQYLTNSVIDGGDGIRFYDGDPTLGTGLPSIASGGWVNFAPPLSAGSQQIININSGNTPFYLVGALACLPFKDRMVFFKPYIQTSVQYLAGDPPIQLSDTVIWSWNGAPYYTASYDGNQNAQTRTYYPIITAGTAQPDPAYVAPAGPQGYYTDETGFGGFLSAGIDQDIITINNNEDVLLVGFTNKQTRFVYTGNDLFPFLFYIINSELGSSSTYSSVTLDRGALTVGSKGILLTTQVSAERIDLQIPDQIFQLGNLNQADLRISGARDFQREWVYFSYVSNTQPVSQVFPSESFFYNYRDSTWAIFYETYTCHGSFRGLNGGIYTWLTIPWTWETWNEPWNSGATTALAPVVCAGNAEGYVVIKGVSTTESVSGYISAISAGTGNTQIVSYNHCVQSSNPLGTGDYLLLSGLVGPNAMKLNGLVGQVISVVDVNTFIIDLPFPSGATDYLGGGQFARLCQPLLQTKQFPTYWQDGYKVRLGVQKYLFDYTFEGQITLLISLSQDPDSSWNLPPIVPLESDNDSLVYSNILFTCPESSNIGLTEITENLNNPSPIANTQKQIWHRMNTALIGDTFQLGLTLSDAQMRIPAQAQSEISLHAAVIDVARGPLLT